MVAISTEHLKHSSSAIAESLALHFTSILRHGYMPKCFRDCVLVPIQKGSNDATLSQNYQQIALASSLVSRIICGTNKHSISEMLGNRQTHTQTQLP